jgi:hypothetical protein
MTDRQQLIHALAKSGWVYAFNLYREEERSNGQTKGPACENFRNSLGSRVAKHVVWSAKLLK